jgi:hypothetical protein
MQWWARHGVVVMEVPPVLWRTMEPETQRASVTPARNQSIHLCHPVLLSSLPSYTHRLFGRFLDKPIPT